MDASELPMQDKIQLWEHTITQQQQQQFEQDLAVQTRASIQMGKRPLPPTDDDHGTTITVQILLDKIFELQAQLKQQTTGTTGHTAQTLVHVQISAPTTIGIAKLSTVDELQGPNDPYKAALGHDDLSIKIKNWAKEVIEIGKLPKPQILAGKITDVSGVIQAEMERMNNSKENHTTNADSHNNVFDVVKSEMTNAQLAVQTSPISVPSNGSSGNGEHNDVNRQIIAQLALGTTGNGGGGDDGDSSRPGNLVDDSGDHNTIGKGGAKISEFISVNPRNIIINMFTGRN